MAHLNSRGHNAQIVQPSCNSVVCANSFFPRTIGDWREPASNRPIKLLNRGLLQEILKFQLRIKNSDHLIQMRSILVQVAPDMEEEPVLFK